MIFRPTIATVVVLVCTAAFAPAQLSGKYTLDSAGSGTRNFKSFPEAIFSLYLSGVSGAVTIEVAPASYSPNAWSFLAVPGASATNTITFRSATRHAAKMVTTKSTSFRIQAGWFVGTAKWIILDGFEFRPGTTGTTFLLDGEGEDLELRSCLFDAGRVTLTGPRMRVHHCTFREISTPMTFAKADATEFHHNDIQAKGGSGFTLSALPNGQSRTPHRIYNNLIHGVFNGQSAVAIGVNTEFTHNTVVMTGGSIPTYVLEIAGVLAVGPRITNNIFVNMVSERVARTGSYVDTKLYFKLDHNLYHWTSNLGAPFLVGTTEYANLALWQAATKQEAGSLRVDPRFKDSTPGSLDLALRDGSPAAGAAAGTPSYVKDDYIGNPRPTPATIGAYEGSKTATFTPFGKGCAGTFGNIPVAGYTGSLLWGSNTFAAQLTNALGGKTVPVFFAAGGTRVNIPFGGNCALLVSPDILFGVSMSGGSGPGNGTASVSIGIPNDPKLKGFQLHYQWGVADPGAKGIGIAFSNGGTLKL